MNKLAGKQDVVLKTMVTAAVAADLQAMATLNRTNVGSLLRHITEKYLYGRVGVLSMDEDRTELQAHRSTGTGTAA